MCFLLISFLNKSSTIVKVYKSLIPVNLYLSLIEKELISYLLEIEETISDK